MLSATLVQKARTKHNLRISLQHIYKVRLFGSVFKKFGFGFYFTNKHLYGGEPVNLPGSPINTEVPSFQLPSVFQFHLSFTDGRETALLYHLANLWQLALTLLPFLNACANGL